MTPLRSGPLTTPIGQLWIIVSDIGLRAVSRTPPTDALPDSEAIAGAAAQLESYFAGSTRDFSLTLDLSGVSVFDARVWHAARTIPYAATVSYGELALMAGHPGAARAVGGAMSRCPLTPVVPCHRVIHADGTIGGWGGETWVKRWMLELERGNADAQ